MCKERTSPHELMVQALNSSLVIFFYRRVKQVHPLGF
jgi:arginine metabolism regulation protein II